MSTPWMWRAPRLARISNDSSVLRFSEWKIIVVAGVLGTLAASLNLLDSFTSFLFTLSVVFAPVAAVYTTDFYLVRNRLVYDLDEVGQLPGFHWPAMLAWLAGIIASMLSNNDLITITSIEACDAVIVTVPAYLLFMKLANQFVKDQAGEISQDN